MNRQCCEKKMARLAFLPRREKIARDIWKSYRKPRSAMQDLIGDETRQAGIRRESGMTFAINARSEIYSSFFKSLSDDKKSKETAKQREHVNVFFFKILNENLLNLSFSHDVLFPFFRGALIFPVRKSWGKNKSLGLWATKLARFTIFFVVPESL